MFDTYGAEQILGEEFEETQTSNNQNFESQNQQCSGDEYITIIAATLGGVMEQFRARQLGAKGFSIVGPAARQHFTFAGLSGSSDMMAWDSRMDDLFGGQAMVGATFKRAARTVSTGNSQ